VFLRRKLVGDGAVCVHLSSVSTDLSPLTAVIVFINLPLDAISLLLLAFALRIKTLRISIATGLKQFDWTGSAAIAGGTICFLCGLESGASAQHSWTSAFTLGLIVGGIILWIIFVVYEWRWAKFPLVPMRVFAGTSNIAAVSTAFFHSFVFIAYDFFLPLYFQVVLGASPIHSGLYLFALVLPLSAMSAGTGIFIKRTGKYRLAAWVGTLIMTLGTGLFIDFPSRTVCWKVIVFQIIAGVGAGPLFLAPMMALQHHLRKEDIAAGTSAFTFLRSISTSISIVVGGVVLQRGGLKGGSLATTSHRLHREQSVQAAPGYTSALANMWIFYTAACGLMIVSAFLIGKHKDAGPALDPFDSSKEVKTGEKSQQEAKEVERETSSALALVELVTSNRSGTELR
jgi:Na+/melibiose symporter-like transporter